MDRIANNESLVICAILDALVCDVNQMAKLYLIVVMSVDRAIRNRVERYSSYNDMVRAESGFDRALNRKFIEMQLVFLNAMTMLMLSGKIEKQDKNRLDLTSDGAKMAFDFQNIEGINPVWRAAQHNARLMLPNPGFYHGIHCAATLVGKPIMEKTVNTGIHYVFVLQIQPDCFPINLNSPKSSRP